MTVYNKRGDVPADAVYIGRPTGWGNPFTHIGRGQGIIRVKSREDAVRGFELLLTGQFKLIREELGDEVADQCNLHKDELLAQHVWMREHLHELKGRNLLCWCAPLACHGDVLSRLS